MALGDAHLAELLVTVLVLYLLPSDSYTRA